jgi:integrase
MSIYFKKGAGWRYDFILQGNRCTKAGFKTKAAARQAEAKKREELRNPPPAVEGPTDMAFLDFVNLRLDYVRAYKSQKYYVDHIYTVKGFVKEWRNVYCNEITLQMVQRYLIRRAKVSAFTANKDLRYLRALFNFGVKQGLVQSNPTNGVEFMPVERKLKYIPSKEDIAKVLLAADPDSQDYLIAIMDSMARVSEINRLTWEDVDLAEKYVVLYTRKKKGGHLTPRKVSMTERLHSMLAKRYENRDKNKPWVFWGRHWSGKTGEFLEGPYQDRKRLMPVLCRKAGVKYFRYHALRHFGASVLERANVPIGSIQRILGHENRTTTEIYLHSIGDAEREAMATFERALQPAPLTENHTRIHTQ